MKTKVLTLTLLLGLLLSGLTACNPSAPPDANGGELEIRPAPIEEIRVNIAESYPVQIFVYIRGGLADGCTTLHDINTQRQGQTVEIEVTTERPKDAVCIQVYGTFEENVALGSDFTAGETYTVKVNDKTTSFTMP